MIATAPVDLESLVEVELPPLPGSAMRVASLTQDFNSSAREIADAIGLDPILAARILRAANSPLYSFERRVTALPMAVSAMGNKNIHLLVVTSATADAFQSKGKRSASELGLWEHSVAVGLAAREIMFMLKLRGVEEGFLCGLLHDIGKLLLLRHEKEAYQQLIKETQETDLLAAERALFGYTHSQVGALVTKRWNLPEAISHSIYHHHDPSQAAQSVLMARVVDVADTLANRAGLGLQPGPAGELAEMESVIALRLSEDQLKEIWEKILPSLSETFSLFS
jgi:putative nucleotidyltransferase with HDIG domain